jgi:hypothetical protein
MILVMFLGRKENREKREERREKREERREKTVVRS